MKIFLFALAFFISFSARTQIHRDSIYVLQFRSAEISGDEAWTKHDTALVRKFYLQAWAISPYEPEIDYRLENINDTTCRFDSTVNKFFFLSYKGDYACKDHSYHYAKNCYKKAIGLARLRGYGQLKRSGYYDEVKNNKKNINRWEHPFFNHLFHHKTAHVKIKN
ncbi:MAG: hypothetical protein HY064_12760 [Bacteroidetes bacterium]|nr:hypothetical protein [Bacteroidota bacterium]